MSELIQGSPPQRTCQAAELTFIWFWLIACVDFSIVGAMPESCVSDLVTWSNRQLFW